MNYTKRMEAKYRAQWRHSAVQHLLTLLLACVAGFASSEPEEVLVTGTALPLLVTHVEAIVTVNRDNQLARWNSSLCLRIEGLPSDQHAIIRERLSHASEKVRISLLDVGCAENVLLFFASDAAQISRSLATHFEVPLRQDSTARVQQFITDTAPARWITTYDRCGFGCRLANSRITASSAPAINFMLLVVDVQQIQGRPMREIAEYLAFAVLANPAPHAKPAVDSVLSLFDTTVDASSTTGLSVYDYAYLEALYTQPMDRYIDSQLNAIGSSMLVRLNDMTMLR